jgi:hypothetical protein
MDCMMPTDDNAVNEKMTALSSCRYDAPKRSVEQVYGKTPTWLAKRRHGRQNAKKFDEHREPAGRASGTAYGDKPA